MKVQSIGYLFEKVYNVGLHSHEFWEVIFFIKGSGNVEIEDRTVPFGEGDIFVIPPDVGRGIMSENGFRSCYFTFADENMNRKGFFKFRDTEHGDFFTILRQLYYEYNLQRKNYEIIVDSLYTVLYHYILALSEDTDGNPYVALLVNDIIANLHDPDYDLTAAIAQLPLNESYVRKLFMQETGKTPLRYLIHRRIEYAKDLLRLRASSGLSIQMIALSSGFRSNYYFSRMFRKVTGTNPRDWALRESGGANSAAVPADSGASNEATPAATTQTAGDDGNNDANKR